MKNPNKFLLGIASNGSRQFTDTARPYNENAPKEQVETLKESIRKKIEDAGLSEMIDAFNFQADII